MFAITKEALNASYAAIRAGAQGKDILEYGCGQGEASLIIANKYNPKSVVGIDISDVAVKHARCEAASMSLENMRSKTMDAEKMNFPDDQFDLICGFGILHHLDLDLALGQLARALKRDGSVFFSNRWAITPRSIYIAG